MPRPAFAFTADNHLRPFSWVKHPDLYGDAYVAWEYITTRCATNQIPLVQLGDLFDKSRPDSASVAHYLAGVNRLSFARVLFYYLQGNHDAADPAWPSLAPGAAALGEVGSVNINGVVVEGIDYSARDALCEQLRNIHPETQVLVTHQSWQEIQRVGHTDGKFADIPRGLTLLTGDYHVCDKYSGLAADGTMVLAYSPGSTAIQALNEPPQKYFGVLYDDLSVQWDPIPSRPVIAMEAKDEAGLDFIVQRLRAGVVLDERLPVLIRKPILHVKYNDAIPEAHNRLVEAAGTNWHLFLSPEYQVTTHVINVDAAPAGAFDDLKSAVGMCCPQGSDVYNGLVRLIDANDRAKTLTQMFQEFTADENPAGTQAAATAQPVS